MSSAGRRRPRYRPRRSRRTKTAVEDGFLYAYALVDRPAGQRRAEAAYRDQVPLVYFIGTRPRWYTIVTRAQRVPARRVRIVRVAVFELLCPAFEEGQPIPRKYTCEGEDVSPPLEWSGVPEGTKSLALVVEDPDAPRGTFTHWLAWGIDPAAGRLGEGERPPVEGRNDFGEAGWRGPCPPPGHGPHRYVFRLHALEGELELRAGVGKAEVERALEGRTRAVAELVGTYER